jgi:hypothetical protein
VTHRISRPDEACASVAPTACSPATTRAKDVAKPVMEATIPAEMGCSMGYRSFSCGKQVCPAYGVKTPRTFAHDAART